MLMFNSGFNSRSNVNYVDSNGELVERSLPNIIGKKFKGPIKAINSKGLLVDTDIIEHWNLGNNNLWVKVVYNVGSLHSIKLNYLIVTINQPFFVVNKNKYIVANKLCLDDRLMSFNYLLNAIFEVGISSISFVKEPYNIQSIKTKTKNCFINGILVFTGDTTNEEMVE